MIFHQNFRASNTLIPGYMKVLHEHFATFLQTKKPANIEFAGFRPRLNCKWAEREGFEPPEAFTSTVFSAGSFGPQDPAGKTVAFPQDAVHDRSAIFTKYP